MVIYFFSVTLNSENEIACVFLFLFQYSYQDVRKMHWIAKSKLSLLHG